MKYLYLFITLLLLFVSFNAFADERLQDDNTSENFIDSIFIWIEYSKDNSLEYQKRKFYINRAYDQALLQPNDSLQNVYLTKIAFTYYFKLGDSLSFRKVNKQAINLSKKINDSINLANNYWDLGNFYRDHELKDSAYYIYTRAQRIYESIKKVDYSGSMLLNMALIQSDYKDYTGSEVTTIKALTVLKPIKKYKQIYRCYNNLGVIFNELEEYNKALYYHNKALEYVSLVEKENNFKANTLNNIGVVHQNKGDLKQALEFFQFSLVNDSLNIQVPRSYARSLDNLASCKLSLKDTLGIKELFLKAYKIRDSIQDYSGMAISKLHLAKYYAFAKDTIKAIQLANETMQLTTTKKNDRDLLASLLLLSKLDKENSHTYSEQYIALNRQLLKQERTIRDKFARIRFETDEYIDENVKLNEQKAKLSEQKNLILIIGSIILLIALLLTIIIDQRSKNIKLRLEKQQQKANEEIFDLMLVQQYKQDEGRRHEKKRISEELHDGVLGKVFGTRLILGTLNDKNDKETVLKRKEYIDELQQVEEEIRNVSHELNYKSSVPNIGFIQMLEKLLENQSMITNFKYQIEYDKKIRWEELSGSLKMNLYRIIQEATQNINKYAKAENVLIEFKLDKKFINLIINDDGIGFNSKIIGKGIGLKNMKSRIHDLEGKISINSEPNEGTAILIEVPF